MNRVLVTGGAGFIGGHLVDALLRRGDTVTVLDDLSTGKRSNVSAAARLVVGSVADEREVLEVVSEGFDAVFHVAGQASISRSFADPGVDLAVNVTGTLNILEACRRSAVPRLVFASSMTVYGEADQVPTLELAPCRPVSYYGVTKYAAECYAQITGALAGSGLAVTSLRMFNFYGERQSLDNPYQGVLAIFIGNLLRDEPLTIYGDGRQTRDFVYVSDVVEAWLRVLDDPATHGRVFNVGSGVETSVLGLAGAVLEAFGHSMSTWDVRFTGAQLGDQLRSLADVRALHEATGWLPRASLAEGMERTVEWALSEVRRPRNVLRRPES